MQIHVANWLLVNLFTVNDVTDTVISVLINNVISYDHDVTERFVDAH